MVLHFSSAGITGVYRHSVFVLLELVCVVHEFYQQSQNHSPVPTSDLLILTLAR